MTLDDLKARATASEMTLIEAVEEAVRDDVESELRKSLIAFCNRDLPPSREDAMVNTGAPDQWLARLSKHLNA